LTRHIGDGKFYTMRNLVIAAILVFISIPAFAVDVAPRISDREIIEGLADIRGDIKELKSEIKRLDEGQKGLRSEMNSRFDMLTWMLGLFITIAMAMGKPVVGFDVGGLKELITHGKDGVLFRAGDGSELFSLLVELTSGRRDTAGISKSAIETVWKKHNWKSAVKRYLPVYEKILSKGANKLIDVRYSRHITSSGL